MRLADVEDCLMSRHLKIKYRPIDSVKPNARNARTHSPEQLQQLARIVKTVGFINPVVVDENKKLLAGHARVLTADLLGLKFIPTICVDHLTEVEKQAYMLADNKLALNAGWDENLLRVELESLMNAEVDFTADITGFSTPEIDLLLHTDPVPEADEEQIPAPDPDNAISRPGDLWVLDRHQVIVGDCREAETIDTLMDGRLARMVLTDAPYNVAVQGHVSGLGKNQHREFSMASGEMSPVEFTGFLTDAFIQTARVSEDGSLLYAFMDWRHTSEILQAGEAAYDRLINVCCWVKSNGGMGSLYRSRHEMVFVFKKGTASHINNVELGKHGRYRTNVWEYAGYNAFGRDRDESLGWHPTVKPVPMLMDAILDVTNPGDIVLDGFLGSGSTLIAAERTRRICYGVELDPAYVDVTIQRWQRESGRQAVMADTGQTFDQVATERGLGEVVVS